MPSESVRAYAVNMPIVSRSPYSNSRSPLSRRQRLIAISKVTTLREAASKYGKFPATLRPPLGKQPEKVLPFANGFSHSILPLSISSWKGGNSMMLSNCALASGLSIRAPLTYSSSACPGNLPMKSAIMVARSWSGPPPACAIHEHASRLTARIILFASRPGFTLVDSVERGFYARLVAPIVHPAHHDLVARFRSTHAKVQEWIFGHRLAPLRLEHGLAVVCRGESLDEMHGHRLTGDAVLAQAGLHRMEYQYFHVSHVAVQLRANFHRIGHLEFPFLFPHSGAAAADRDLDFAHRGVELAARPGQDPYDGRFVHLYP